MKKRIKLFLAAAIAAIVSVVAGFYSYRVEQENKLALEQSLLLENEIDALTDIEWSHMFSSFAEYMNSDMSFSDYWDSKIWKCYLYKNTSAGQRNDSGWYATNHEVYQISCVAGNEVDHCYCVLTGH